MITFLKSASISWSAFFLIFIINCNPVKAQDAGNQFQPTSDTLASLFKSIQVNSQLPDEVNLSNQKIILLLEKFLCQKDAFDFSFKIENSLSDLVSDDKKIRILTWTLPPEVGIYRCYGFILLKDSKTKTTKVFKLKEQEEKIEKPEHKIFHSNNWLSCVYYNIITKKYKNKTWYTLLGWSGNDGITNKKIIEILTITQKGEPVFGAPVFQLRKLKSNRMIFEYNPQAIMFMNYDEKKQMILFDHLSPNEPSMTGRFQYYGPDFSVDGLKFKKGIWILEEDVDAKNKN